ncbi:MAG: cation diffusion facilitator family transporter [Bacteroidota bacterium]
MEKHAHHHENPSERLLVSILLNGAITLAEIAGGILSNSLSLVSEAIHNLSDTLALTLTWVANRVGGRKPDARRTFGYKRFEILSAFINAALLTGISVYLSYIAVVRFMHPETVATGLMLVVASVGFTGNLVSMLFLHRDSKKSLNVKAAYLHLLGDTISSLAVIAGALFIRYTGIVWIDPLLTILISCVILVQAWGILRESVDILMQSTPQHLDLASIKTLLEKQPCVRNIHHVHCWQLQDHDILFEAHISTTEDMLLSDSNILRGRIEKILQENFSITHTTLEIEFETCHDTSMISQPCQNPLEKHPE